MHRQTGESTHTRTRPWTHPHVEGVPKPSPASPLSSHHHHPKTLSFVHAPPNKVMETHQCRCRQDDRQRLLIWCGEPRPLVSAEDVPPESASALGARRLFVQTDRSRVQTGSYHQFHYNYWWIEQSTTLHPRYTKSINERVFRSRGQWSSLGRRAEVSGSNPPRAPVVLSQFLAHEYSSEAQSAAVTWWDLLVKMKRKNTHSPRASVTSVHWAAYDSERDGRIARLSGNMKTEGKYCFNECFPFLQFIPPHWGRPNLLPSSLICLSIYPFCLSLSPTRSLCLPPPFPKRCI